MKFEEMYVAKQLVRNLYYYQYLTAEDQTKALAGVGVSTDFLQYTGTTQMSGAHGYSEPTRTFYYAGVRGPFDVVKDEPLVKRNGDVIMTALKVGLKSKKTEYKYLITPESLEDIPIPDEAILSYYALSVAGDGKIKDQVDVYFTLREYLELVRFADSQEFDQPLPDDTLFHEDDMIGATYAKSSKAPIRLKYYHLFGRDSMRTLNRDGTVDSQIAEN